MKQKLLPIRDGLALFISLKTMPYKMRTNFSMHRAVIIFATLLLVAVTGFFVNAQTPETPSRSSEKLSVREKVRLPDYKGPRRRFIVRKALITFSPNGRLVVMSGRNRSITVWDAETGALKATLLGGQSNKDGISGFAFSPDGRTAATRDFFDKSVRLWDVETWKVRASLPGRKRNLETKMKAGAGFEEEFGPVPFSADGSRVLSEREDDVVAVSDVTNGQERMTLKHDTRGGTKDTLRALFLVGTRHFLFLQTGYSPDGRWIFTINGDKSAKVWDAATGKLQTDITNSERIYRASFTPDSAALLTVEQQGGMKLWEAETGQLRAVVAPKSFLEDLIKGYEFSREGNRIATFILGDTRLWDSKTGASLHKLPNSQTTDATFSPDGRWLATASEDSKSAATIWDVETGAAKLSLASTGNKSVSVIYSPDGSMLATTNDRGVTLWDGQTGDLLATLGEARYPVAFSPDGHTMVTGGRNDTAILWELQRSR
jgi:WD40 repeat protein